jgi:hypothetical protein
MKISFAQKVRWSKTRWGSKPAAAKTTGSAPVKRTLSASARRKIAKGEMGEGEGGEEGGASSGTKMKPAASVAATLFNEESLRLVFRMT